MKGAGPAVTIYRFLYCTHITPPSFFLSIVLAFFSTFFSVCDLYVPLLNLRSYTKNITRCHEISGSIEVALFIEMSCLQYILRCSHRTAIVCYFLKISAYRLKGENL